MGGGVLGSEKARLGIRDSGMRRWDFADSVREKWWRETPREGD